MHHANANANVNLNVSGGPGRLSTDEIGGLRKYMYTCFFLHGIDCVKQRGHDMVHGGEADDVDVVKASGAGVNVLEL